MTTRSSRRTSASRDGTPGPSKLQRWVDLLAALLARRFPATFAELRKDVPAYLSRPADDSTLLRMFERDKDELRAFGVPIQTTVSSDGAASGYQLRSHDFYLPVLAVAASGAGAHHGRTADAAGYRAAARLTFEPDELAAIADALARVRALGDPLLTADADSAMRKLAFELPLDAARDGDDERIVAERIDARRFTLLGRALLGRKVVRFDYHAMSTDATTRREVEPYGLAFLGSHWYLVARDRARGELRHFRLSRMSKLAVSRTATPSPDYAIPLDFHLEEHARSREAWELGDEAPAEVTVEFRGTTGAVQAAATLGDAVRGVPGQRRFHVRRPDAFARWLLSFGGDAVPVAPPPMVARFQALARDTLAEYHTAGGAA
ncbi:MAG TPA: WYL domain-containing protein [Gemmatimonadaceae bacterium]|nr:WYL domain-containing protein [Gemmatimonadaceae bacterium]